MTALVTAVFAGLVALRHARRYTGTADALELRAYRDAWLWSVRTIYSLLAMPEVPERPDIRAEMREHQTNIDNPTEKQKETT